MSRPKISASLSISHPRLVRFLLKLNAETLSSCDNEYTSVTRTAAYVATHLIQRSLDRHLYSSKMLRQIISDLESADFVALCCVEDSERFNTAVETIVLPLCRFIEDTGDYIYLNEEYCSLRVFAEMCGSSREAC